MKIGGSNGVAIDQRDLTTFLTVVMVLEDGRPIHGSGTHLW